MCHPPIRIQPIMKHNREQVNQCYTHELVMLDPKREQEKIQLHLKTFQTTSHKDVKSNTIFALKMLVVGCYLLCK